MVERQHLQLALDDDRTALALRVLSADRELFSVRLEAPELDELIRALSRGRAQLGEEVAPELDEGARIADTVIDPSYLIGKNSRKDRALLAFRHPGFGWLGFQLRRSVVEPMVRQLDEWLREGRSPD